MKKGSTRLSGNTKLKQIFESLIRSKDFQKFAELKRKEFEALPDDFEVFQKKSLAWYESIKEYCTEKGLDDSLAVLLSIIIRHGKTSWLSVTTQELVKIKEVTKKGYRSFPIQLEISPYASRNNIIEFIERNYTTEIKPLQEKYAVYKNLIKVRKKRTQERDDYVLEMYNQGKPNKAIADATNKRFPSGSTLTYDDVAKIIKKVSGI